MGRPRTRPGSIAICLTCQHADPVKPEVKGCFDPADYRHCRIPVGGVPPHNRLIGHSRGCIHEPARWEEKKGAEAPLPGGGAATLSSSPPAR